MAMEKRIRKGLKILSGSESLAQSKSLAKAQVDVTAKAREDHNISLDNGSRVFCGAHYHSNKLPGIEDHYKVCGNGYLEVWKDSQCGVCGKSIDDFVMDHVDNLFYECKCPLYETLPIYCVSCFSTIVAPLSTKRKKRENVAPASFLIKYKSISRLKILFDF